MKPGPRRDNRTRAPGPRRLRMRRSRRCVPMSRSASRHRARLRYKRDKKTVEDSTARVTLNSGTAPVRWSESKALACATHVESNIAMTQTHVNVMQIDRS